MEIQVREATSDDFPAIARLTVDVYVGEGFSPPEAASTPSDIPSRAAAALILVAVEGSTDEPCGVVTLLLDVGPLAQVSHEDEAEVRTLAVAPRCRRQGIGEALTRECIARAEAAKRRSVVLSTQPTMTAAHRLYEHLGFVRDHGRDWKRRDGRPMLAYRLDLATR